MPVFVEFSRPRNDKQGPRLGPFEWVQLTYHTLRIPPDGVTLAYFNPVQGDWVIVGLAAAAVAHWDQELNSIKGINEARADGPWSDIVIASD